MAKRRENARLQRALEMMEENRQVIGQFLVLGFGTKPRLLEFEARGRSMIARDTETRAEKRVKAATVWGLIMGKSKPKLASLPLAAGKKT